MKMKTPILQPSWLRVRWIALMLVITPLMGACGFLSTPKTIHVNQSLLQTAVTKKWTDIAKTMSDNGMVATEPKVVLIPDKQRIGAQFDAVVETGLFGGVMRGKMQMSGVPMYNPEVQAIVLKEFAVDSFELNNAPSMLDGLARRAVSMMVGKKVGVDVPVYFIKREQLSFAGKEWLPEKIEVEAERLNITLQPHGQ